MRLEGVAHLPSTTEGDMCMWVLTHAAAPRVRRIAADGEAGRPRAHGQVLRFRFVDAPQVGLVRTLAEPRSRAARCSLRPGCRRWRRTAALLVGQTSLRTAEGSSGVMWEPTWPRTLTQRPRGRWDRRRRLLGAGLPAHCSQRDERDAGVQGVGGGTSMTAEGGTD